MIPWLLYKSTCLLFGRSKPEIDENEGELQDDAEAVDGNYREVFPPAAHHRQSIPSIREAVEQCNDVWHARKLLRAPLSRHPRKC